MIYLGADHAGYKMKERIKEYLDSKGLPCQDLGACDEQVSDHPVYAFKVASRVAKSRGRDRGILVCGTGIGMSIAANRVRGVRAVLATNPIQAKLSRQHNDSNILALGGRLTPWPEARKIVDVWLKTKAEKKTRYLKRIQQYDR